MVNLKINNINFHKATQSEESTHSIEITPQSQIKNKNQQNFTNLERKKQKDISELYQLETSISVIAEEDIDLNYSNSDKNSINNEIDYLPNQIKQRNKTKLLHPEKDNLQLLFSSQPCNNKTHFSPKSSVKIKIIDETDTDN